MTATPPSGKTPRPVMPKCDCGTRPLYAHAPTCAFLVAFEKNTAEYLKSGGRL